MPEVDFDREFNSFVASGDSSTITDIYKIIPTLSDEQIKIVTTLRYYIAKYDLPDLDMFLSNYLLSKSDNKNLSFISSMNVKALLKAQTMEELVKGINISSMSKKEV